MSLLAREMCRCRRRPCDADHGSAVSRPAAWFTVNEFHANCYQHRPAPLAEQRISTMSEKTIGFEDNEDEILSFQVSDETLESAAAVWKEKAGGLTISFCSGLSTCPA
jgi:hypothetical protein